MCPPPGGSSIGAVSAGHLEIRGASAFLLPGRAFRRNDHVSGHEKEEPAASPGGSGGHAAPGHQRGAVPAGGRRLPLRRAPELCVPQREAVLPLRQGRPQAGRHPAGGEVLFLRHRPRPGGAGKVHHAVPQRHRLWTGAGPGGRRGKARRSGGLGGAVQPGGAGKPGEGNLQHMGQRVRAGDGD